MSLLELHPLLKQIHVASAIVSVSGYILRVLLMLRNSPLLHARLTRVAPHIVDTLLLTSAILLALNIEQYPFAQSWLTAKLIALIAYIVLGALGLRYARTKQLRVVFALAALLVFSYIVSVALTRSPLLALH